MRIHHPSTQLSGSIDGVNRLSRTLSSTLRRHCCKALLLLLCGTPFHASAQVLHLAELNTAQVLSLDRPHTVVLIPNGILEEHGPYLPSYTDGYWDEALTQDLARRIVARPGWTAVLFPPIPLGTNPANVVAHRYTFPGSFTVSQATIRSVFMDLADSFGEQGFRTILIIDSHGGPTQSLALDAASAYFHDTYGGTMTHLLGAMPIFDCCHPLEETLTPQQVQANGMSIHADALEHSQVLFTNPNLVDPAYRSAAPNGAADFPGLTASATRPDWPGYLGSPAYASAALGARFFRELSDAVASLAFDIIDGKVDPAKLPRYGATMMPLTAAIEAPMLEHEQAVAERHRKWLAANPPPK